MVNKSQLKRKLPVNGTDGGKKKKLVSAPETNGKQQKKSAPKISPQLMEEIQSDSEEETNNVDEDDLIESEVEETAQEKKIRLAKSFIEELQKQKEEDAADRNNVEYISRRLEEDLQAKTGKLRREIAHKYKSATIEHQLKGHRLTVTCAVISADKKILFSGSKDGSIIKWNATTGRKEASIKKRVFGKDSSESKGHSDEILCMAISSDSQYLATGGKDKSIKIWNANTSEFVYSFEGHRDAVSGVVFQQNTHQLYSASFDRSVKVWDVDQLVYIETLFGHQDKIMGIDTLSKERCITCGARDRTIRMWKIIEESQLLFNGANYDSIDCVSLINEETFISGSNDGSLGIWNINKKKPVSTVKEAHKKGSNGDTTGWISAVASYHNSDLLASGSDDGFIRVWTFSEAAGTLKQQLTIPVDGFVNDLKFSEDGNYLVAAIGQEHRLGRWSTIKKAKNSTLLIKMNIDEEK